MTLPTPRMVLDQNIFGHHTSSCGRVKLDVVELNFGQTFGPSDLKVGMHIHHDFGRDIDWVPHGHKNNTLNVCNYVYMYIYVCVHSLFYHSNIPNESCSSG